MKRFEMGLPALIASAVLALAGCGDSGQRHLAGGGGHHHGSVHGGVAVELGEHQFHLDFLHEPAEGVLKAWVMDAHVENFVRVPWPTFDVRVVAGGVTNVVVLTAQADATTGETVGDTSFFQGRSDSLKGVTGFSASIPALEIRGRRFSDVRFEYPAR